MKLNALYIKLSFSLCATFVRVATFVGSLFFFVYFLFKRDREMELNDFERDFIRLFRLTGDTPRRVRVKKKKNRIGLIVRLQFALMPQCRECKSLASRPFRHKNKCICYALIGSEKRLARWRLKEFSA